MLDASTTRPGPLRSDAPASPATRPRRYLMCPPEHFDVVYVINPWMDPTRGANPARACAQWSTLHAAYVRAGHTVETIAPGAGLPDMVFAANSALVVDDTAYLARFRYAERAGEEALYEKWFAEHGLAVVRSRHVHEGEGDFAVNGDVILAATGFRTEIGAHREVERVFDREVVSLELVDPRHYHLDTALFVLGNDNIVYYPPAFSDASRRELERRYPDAVIASDDDAAAFGCNAACDGQRVFLPAGATDLAARLRVDGFTVTPLDLSELRKAGGSVKCCTLELRSREEAR
jgi:N-dimethylarginine dimethylaminohydrolase